MRYAPMTTARDRLATPNRSARPAPLRSFTLAALAALALAAPSAAGAQGPSPHASCDGVLSSLVAHEQRRDDVSYFVKLGADMGLRENSGAFFSFYAHQHAGSADACQAIPEP